MIPTALIIGGTTGIGQSIAQVLENTHQVTAIGRTQWNINLSPPPWPLEQFDVVVFSAGVELGGDQNFFDQDFSDINITLQTNLISQIRWFHQYCQHRHAPARVIFVGSAHSGERVSMHKTIYSITRIAMREFIIATRKELKEKNKDITVSLLRFGCVKTNFHKNKYHHMITDDEDNDYYNKKKNYFLPEDIKPYVNGILDGSLIHCQEIIISKDPT